LRRSALLRGSLALLTDGAAAELVGDRSPSLEVVDVVVKARAETTVVNKTRGVIIFVNFIVATRCGNERVGIIKQ